MITVNDYRGWRNFLDCLCGDSNMILCVPLGEWNFRSTSDWLSQQDWFINDNIRQLYHHTIGSICVIHPKRGNSHYTYETNSRVCACVPNGELLRANFSHIYDRILVRNTATRVVRTVQEHKIMVFDDIVLKHPKLDWFNSYMSCLKKTQLSIRSHYFWQYTCCK